MPKDDRNSAVARQEDTERSPTRPGPYAQEGYGQQTHGCNVGCPGTVLASTAACSFGPECSTSRDPKWGDEKATRTAGPADAVKRLKDCKIMMLWACNGYPWGIPALARFQESRNQTRPLVNYPSVPRP